MTMPPSSSDVKAMGDIIAALNNIAATSPAEDYADYLAESADTSDKFIAEAMPTTAPVATSDGTMRDILSRFNSVAETLTETAEDKPTLREALKTTPTKTGVIIGEWQIEKTDRTYSVVNTSTTHPIATSLGLYEAALALTKALNQGKTINSVTVKEILRLEEEFSKNLADAARYKKQHATADEGKQSILEARYSDSRQKAIHAKNGLKALSE